MKKQENMVANEDVLFGSAYGKLEAVRYPQQMPPFVFLKNEGRNTSLPVLQILC